MACIARERREEWQIWRFSLASRSLFSERLMGEDDHGRPFFHIDGEFDPNEGTIAYLPPIQVLQHQFSNFNRFSPSQPLV